MQNKEAIEAILELKHVSKNFGGITASDNICISVPREHIYGIIGPNGAGKTTLFNMITGVYDTTDGEIYFKGKKINGLPTATIAKLGIARTFQNIRLFGSLSVYDNILTACQKNITYSLLDSLFRTPKCRKQEKAMAEYCEELLEAVGLIEYRDQQADNLPYGLQRRLEIARAMATTPQLILLDEPAAGMNEEESMALTAFVQSIRDKYGITIVIIDHHMDVIMALCDHITVLNFGQLLANGSPDEIQTNPDVIEAYLGVDDEC